MLSTRFICLSAKILGRRKTFHDTIFRVSCANPLLKKQIRLTPKNNDMNNDRFMIISIYEIISDGIICVFLSLEKNYKKENDGINLMQR